MIIHSATRADAALLARIHSQCFDDPWNEESFRRFLDRAGAIAFVGRTAAATDLQSLILIQVAAEESEILTIGTVPGARRSGLARALLVEAAAEAQRRKAAAMFLEVAEDNSAALALYIGLGFVLNGRRRAYYHREGRAGVDALMLRASLPL